MARGTLSENERQCLDAGAKSQPDRLQDAEKTSDCKTNGLRVRFLDEEGKTERMVSTDEVDFAVSRVKKIHILKNRSSSETSILLRNPSLMKRRSSSERRFSDGHTDNINNNSTCENLNGTISILKFTELDNDKTDDTEQTKEINSQSFKKNCNVYSVNQAKTLTPERKKSIPLTMPRLIGHKMQENSTGKSFLPAEVCLADGASGKDFTARAIGRLSRGIGKLLRRTNSVRISDPDPVYKVAYLGNVLTGWARVRSPELHEEALVGSARVITLVLQASIGYGAAYHQILTALNFYARGSYQGSVGQNMDGPMAQQTVSRCLQEVTTALNAPHILRKYIKFPQNRNERNVIKRRFYEKYRLTGVIGCIDCTHIAIVRPVEHEEQYFNRKHFHSLNTQVICDSDCYITNVDASFGGATHDAYIWRECDIRTHMEGLRDETVYLLGESCIEKPLATLWRNYQQSTKPDVVMKLSVTNSGLKGFTKEHGLTEYWSHRITYCASPPHYPKLFCWVYRHEGKKLKHELRCHAVLCTKESISKKITEELQVKLKQALVEFKKDRISKQNARLSLANSVYENPTMPRRKILLSVGSMNYRPPLERSKSAPKLGAIEEMCSEEDEEEAQMNNKHDTWTRTSFDNSTGDNIYLSQTLDRRRPDSKSPRKLSCPEGIINRTLSDPANGTVTVTDDLLDLIAKESNKKNPCDVTSLSDVEKEFRLKTLESIAETSELNDSVATDGECKIQMLTQSNFLVTDSDDGSVSSGCETASTVTDTEPSSLPSFPQEDVPKEMTHLGFDTEQVFEHDAIRTSNRSYANTIHIVSDIFSNGADEVNHVPIGEKNGFRRRSTYPPLGAETTILNPFDGKFESLIDNLTDVDSLNSSAEAEVFKSTGDNDSACSDESGYSELLDGKESIIGSTIMV